VALFKLAVALHYSVIFGFPFLGYGDLDGLDRIFGLVAFTNGVFVLLLVVVKIGLNLYDVYGS
jgi:hypothetical protein